MRTDGRIMTSTSRSATSIFELHVIPTTALEGRVIYDLGCGHSDLQRDLLQEGIEAEVVGFDANPAVIERAVRLGHMTQKIMTSLDNLPVESNSADLVLATYSFPLYAQSKEEIEGFFQEAKRVVRPNGLLSILPVTPGTGGRGFDKKSEIVGQQVDAIVASPEWLIFNLPYNKHLRLTAQKL